MTALPFLARHWKLIGIGLIVSVLLGTTAYYRIDRDRLLKVVAVLRIDLTKAKARTEAEIAKHQATKRAYQDAQAEAERMEAERLARITAQQERINNDRLSAFNRRITDARSTADRLRRQGAPGNGPLSASGCQPVPNTPNPSGASQAACGDEFSIARRLIATEQATQLDELITAVEQHRAVPVN